MGSDGTVVQEFEGNISTSEVRKAVEKVRRHKGSSSDNIPYEVFKNDTAISFLHILFNVCYESGRTPAAWGKGGNKPNS